MVGWILLIQCKGIQYVALGLTCVPDQPVSTLSEAINSLGCRINSSRGCMLIRNAVKSNQLVRLQWPVYSAHSMISNCLCSPRDQGLSLVIQKNSGHLWLAYTELQGGFNMLQLISVDSGHSTQPELWLQSTNLYEIKSVMVSQLDP